MIWCDFHENQTNGLGGIQKVVYQSISKWWTASSADHGILGISALGMTQWINEDQSHDNRQKVLAFFLFNYKMFFCIIIFEKCPCKMSWNVLCTFRVWCWLYISNFVMTRQVVYKIQNFMTKFKMVDTQNGRHRKFTDHWTLYAPQALMRPIGWFYDTVQKL